MKNILFFIALLVTPCFIHAQEHLDFRGVPIDGNLENMVTELVKLGYEKTEVPNALTGKFIGKECILVIDTSEFADNNVQMVGVVFNNMEDWRTIKGEFLSIEDMYTKKYGKPTSEIKRFYRPYEEGDGYEMLAIKKNKCTYSTQWDLNNGKIIITIGDGNILIGYQDKINSEKGEKAEEQAYINEI